MSSSLILIHYIITPLSLHPTHYNTPINITPLYKKVLSIGKYDKKDICFLTLYDGDTLLYPSASYKGHHVAVSGNAMGEYAIERHNGWQLTFSAVGYKSKTINVTSATPVKLDVKLKPDTKQLKEVVVKSKRGKYSRKDNPAVELMRRVIAAKKKTDLQNHDYLQYNKYQKITLALNDIKPSDLDSGFFAKKQWLIDQIETSPFNHKLILPVSVDETVSQQIYRKDPKSEKSIIKGQSSTGINRATSLTLHSRMCLLM